MNDTSSLFAEALVTWYRLNKRDLPWRLSRDPYRVWISEVILQQTRVAFGKDYFMRFTEAFPDVVSLAEADESEVLKMWEGLGYYSRARNLHFAARQIMREFGGKFPEKFEEIRELKGIGPYTAGAVASIAFGQEIPAVDGNALRVGARFWGIETNILAPKTVAEITALFSNWMRGHEPGEFNQAVMELGSMVCTKGSPRCEACPLAQGCVARAKNRTADLPLRWKPDKTKSLWIDYHLAPDRSGRVPLRQRRGQGIWEGLWEFPNLLSESDFTENQGKDPVMSFLHVLTHRKLHIRVFLDSDYSPEVEYQWFSLREAEQLPKPVPVVRILNHLRDSKLI